MVKAKDFWETICNNLEYRFFSGVACPGLLPLYKQMSSDILHYVPAANERIALGLVSGAYLSGFKGGVLLDGRFVTDLERLISFNLNYKVPFLMISYGGKYVDLDIPATTLSSLNDIVELDQYYEKELSPIHLIIEEGSLS